MRGLSPAGGLAAFLILALGACSGSSGEPPAPGSDAFAYAGTVDGTTGVWVQPVEADAEPVLVAEGGRHVSWSPG